MRNERRFLPSEVYFVTIRTVEQRFALEPLSCPGAWNQAEGDSIDIETRMAMRERGQTCITTTEALTQAIALSEQKHDIPRPEVPIETFTDSIPNIVGKVMARGVELFGVHIYAFVWMSNHVHLLIRAPKGNFAAFMAYLNGQVAVNVNRFLGRKHALWSRRYSATQVLDDTALLQLLGYTLANPENAGIVHSIEEWAGLSSASFLLEGREQRFLRFDRTAWFKHRRPRDIAPFLSTITLKHETLPQLTALNGINRIEKIHQLIHEQRKTVPLTEARAPEPLAMVFRRQLIARTAVPTDRPASATPNRRRRSKQPLYHTTNPELGRVYRAWHREFRSEYKRCSLEYRQGNVNVLFPQGSFAPTNYPSARYAATDATVPTATNLATAVMHMLLAA